MTKLSVLEVLETATLGGIGLWATREQVQDRLGAPDTHGLDDALWVYGVFELVFDGNDRLRRIYSDHFDRPGVPGTDGRPTDMGFLRRNMGRRAVSEEFRRAGWAKLRHETSASLPELTYLCFPSGARLMFAPDGLFGLIVDSQVW